MCLVKDPSKRPTAQKLLKQSFFKQARSHDYIARKILEGLPSLEDRFQALKVIHSGASALKHSHCSSIYSLHGSTWLQVKEAELLAQKKMLDGEKEAMSQVCFLILIKLYQNFSCQYCNSAEITVYMDIQLCVSFITIGICIIQWTIYIMDRKHHISSTLFKLSVHHQLRGCDCTSVQPSSGSILKPLSRTFGIATWTFASLETYLLI